MGSVHATVARASTRPTRAPRDRLRRMSSTELAAADGLTARITDHGVTIAYAGHDDWFGPGELQRAGVPVGLGAGTRIEGVDDLGAWRATAWLGVGRAEHPSGRLDASVCAYDDEPILVFSLRAPAGITEPKYSRNNSSC